MPYIKQEDRKYFDIALDKIKSMDSKGELEYCIWKLMKIYMSSRQVSYTTLHDTAYAAHHCGDEFRRRYLDSRENFARETNGDIHPKLGGEIWGDPSSHVI